MMGPTSAVHPKGDSMVIDYRVVGLVFWLFQLAMLTWAVYAVVLTPRRFVPARAGRPVRRTGLQVDSTAPRRRTDRDDWAA